MNRFFLLLMLVVVACNKTELESPCNDTLTATFNSCSSVISVGASQCIIKEAIIQNPNETIPLDKFVYHHDGTNYDKIDRYYREVTNVPFPVTPTETINFNYYSTGLIYQVTHTSCLNPGKPSTNRFTYIYSGNKLTVRTEGINSDGSVGFSYDNDELYVLNPKDSLYYFDGRVYEEYTMDARTLTDFKNSNVKRKARPWKDGSCSMYGAKWFFGKNYYDDLPNVLKNYAVRFPLNQGKTFYGTMAESYVETNVNNIVGRVYNDGKTDRLTQHCWTFLRNSSNVYWIKAFRLIGGDSQITPNYVLTYHYDCE